MVHFNSYAFNNSSSLKTFPVEKELKDLSIVRPFVPYCLAHALGFCLLFCLWPKLKTTRCLFAPQQPITLLFVVVQHGQWSRVEAVITRFWSR